ncbi:MAG: pilus assembly protein CpaF [Verrucomicrobiales bacterium]|jgi:pilus assembly protein CpaF
MVTSVSPDELLVGEVHGALWREVELSDFSDADLVPDLDAQIRRLIAQIRPLATPKTIATTVTAVTARIDGLGPLHELAVDPAVSEIMINGDGRVWVERAGALEETDQRLSFETTKHLIRRLASTAGRRIDLTNPSVDVRLADGSRLHAIIPPLAVDGPCVTIRRFATRAIALHELAAPSACALLRDAVGEGRSIVIAGGTSSGKTTMLNALAATIDDASRIVTIEDAAELRLPGRHVVRLETRIGAEGVEAVGLRELVRHALRMRPDRIICGEMRGAEALDLIQAMNTGHRGSMTTVHANDASGALRRIETMMLLGDADLPLAAIREQIAACIDLLVMVDRAPGGSRRVRSISRVPDRPTEGWDVEQLFSSEGSA